jgi:hypothetical protein
MQLTELYQIDGKPLLAPVAGVEMSFQDLDDAQSGRDESGYMHRIVVRHKVGVWNFVYSHLTRDEYIYLLSILPTGGSFTFTYCAPDGSMHRTDAYLSGYGVVWQDARTGQYRNMKFSIIEC